jgi:hypothetical protein
MLSSCTANDTTLFIGASVPTTNDAPVGVFWFGFVPVDMVELHPTAARTAALKNRIARREVIAFALGDIEASFPARLD